MRIGIVCPYSFDVPGGVQNHVHDLAEALIRLGHEVSVLAPADEDAQLPPYAVSAGRAVPVPYNGSVARLAFGPISASRVRRWLSAGRFDVLHVHEPVTPSLSMLAVLYARTPVVATFHTATTRSRAMAAAQGALQVGLEKITARIAVSDSARRVQVEHLDGGGWEIPNGVAVAKFAHAAPLPGWPVPGGSVGFLGRFTESRKGFPILLNALSRLVPHRPELRLLVAGPGDPEDAVGDRAWAVRDRITFLGMVSEDDKARIDKILDYDCSWALPEVGRFRVNIMKQRGSFSIIMRVIPWEVPTFDKLGLPPVLAKIAETERGMVTSRAHGRCVARESGLRRTGGPRGGPG